MTRWEYDLLIVGAGLFGSIVCREALDRGLRVLVVDRRTHIGGNCFTDTVEGIHVHRYGAHIFRTDDLDTWRYMERFCVFNNFVNSPMARYGDRLFNLPFNLNTFYQLWGVRTPEEARAEIERQRIAYDNPSNLEEHVLNLVGRDIYEKLVRGYTEKQWGKPCSQLPVSIMRRIPLRFRFDNNYYNDRYQGVPMGGFTPIFEKLLSGADVRLGVEYAGQHSELAGRAPLTVYTGTIDSYYGYRFGALEYRSLAFRHEVLDVPNYQGVAVMNYTERDVPYTRSIEHKHFEFGEGDTTVVSYEYPASWSAGDEPYYPLESDENLQAYARYRALAEQEEGVRFGGRLGEYRYYDMQDTVKSARAKAREWLSEFADGRYVPEK